MTQDQLDQARRTAYLVTGFIRNDLTPAERVELDNWIAASDENMKLFGRLTDPLHMDEAKEWFAKLDLESAGTRMRDETSIRKNGRMSGFDFRWVAAASVLIVLIATFFLFRGNKREQILAAEEKNEPVYAIMPGSKKAILWKNEKEQIDLSDDNISRIQIDDNNQAINSGSVLSYSSHSSHVVWHKLMTPRGGEYQLVLPDGTWVRLNAESSITYPTAFNDAKRQVQLTGEAYFEVPHDATKPFEVQSGKMTIRVIGTSFNVQAYTDTEKSVSLLEGQVNVSVNQQEKELNPRQKATITSQGEITVQTIADIEQDIAWTKGRFSFSKTSLEQVLLQLGRWYDVEFHFSRLKEQQEFTGDIQRNSSLQEVLRMLQLSTGYDFTIHGKLIRVNP